MSAADRARDAFHAAFSVAPDALASAPGRVNLIGEHIDYSGGHVLPFALAQRCAVAASASPAPRLRLLAADSRQRVEIDLAEPLTSAIVADLVPAPAGPNPSWPRYVVGVAALLRDASPNLPGADLAFASGLPVGQGLSSSAALEVSTAMALARAWKLHLAPLDLCRLCRRAEHVFAGVPCGIMDQMASALARAGHALLIDCASERFEHVPIPTHAALVTIDTRTHHDLASTEYAARRAASDRAARALGVPFLCHATPPMLKHASLAPDERDAAAHAIHESLRTLAAAEALRTGDLPTLGRLMLESHHSLRDLYRVSCPELDAVVRAAQAVPGVHGARLTGGGFGGSAIALCCADAVAPLRERVTRDFRREFPGRECAVEAVSPGAGALADLA